MKEKIKMMTVKCSFNLQSRKAREKAGTSATIALTYVSPCSGKSVQLPIGTKYRVMPKDWCKRRKRPICPPFGAGIEGQCYSEVCQRLIECERLFHEWKDEILRLDEIPEYSDAILRERITGKKPDGTKAEVKSLFQIMIEDSQSRNEIEEGTKRLDLKEINRFRAFIEKKRLQISNIGQVTIELLREYKNHLLDPAIDLRPETIKTALGRLQTCLKRQDIDPRALKDFTKFKNMETPARFFLTEEELEKLYDLNLTGEEKTVRDIFCLHAWIGQRIGDMNLGNAIFDEKADMLVLMQEKGKGQIKIPLHLMNFRARQILNEYHFKFDVPSNYNDILSKICSRLECLQDIIIYTEQKGGTEVVQKQARRCDLITSHDARHSFCTNRLIDHWTEIEVRAISGHRSRKAFEQYNHFSAEYFKKPECNALRAERVTSRQTAPQAENKPVEAPKAVEVVPVVPKKTVFDSIEEYYRPFLDISAELMFFCLERPENQNDRIQIFERINCIVSIDELKEIIANDIHDNPSAAGVLRSHILDKYSEIADTYAFASQNEYKDELVSVKIPFFKKYIDLDNQPPKQVLFMIGILGKKEEMTLFDLSLSAMMKMKSELHELLFLIDGRVYSDNVPATQSKAQIDLNNLREYVLPELFVKKGRGSSKIVEVERLLFNRTAKEVATIAKFFHPHLLKERYKFSLNWDTWLPIFYDAVNMPTAYHYRASELPDDSLTKQLNGIFPKTTK